MEPGPIILVAKNSFLGMIRLNFTNATFWANSADDKLMIFFLIFPMKQVFQTLCKLPPEEIFCMKCQSHLGKIRKYFKVSSVECLTQHAKR